VTERRSGEYPAIPEKLKQVIKDEKIVESLYDRKRLAP